jgi:hypothetical protein
MRSSLLAAAGAAFAGLSGTAQAYVTVHVEASRANQARIAADAFEEDFSAVRGTPFVSDFGGAGVNATFDGVSLAADGILGEAFGVVHDRATVKLDRMAKYFGYRAAALDGTTVELFSNGTSLGSFGLVDSPQQAGVVGSALASALGRFVGSEQEAGFTYVNLFSTTWFDEVRFTRNGGSFALDDVRVAYVMPVPEPATWAMMIMGFGATGAALRRRAQGVRFA